MDYSKFSDADLDALSKEDYDSMSTEGLQMVVAAEEQTQQVEAPPEAAPETQEQVVARETEDRMGRLNQASNEATAILNDPASSPEARQDAQDSIVGFNSEKNQLMSAPKWQQNAKEMEGRPLLDLEDAGKNLHSSATEFGVGFGLKAPAAIVRGVGEASDYFTGGNAGQYGEDFQNWNSRRVAEARESAGRNPEETSFTEQAGKIAFEAFLANKLPYTRSKAGAESVTQMFDRIKNIVVHGGFVGGMEGGTNYVPDAGEDYSFSDLEDKTREGALFGAGTYGALSYLKPVTNFAVKEMRDLKDWGKNTWDGIKSEGRLANKVAGEEKMAVIKELEKPASNDPRRPMTAGVAATDAKSPEFSALQRESDSLIPSREIVAREATDGLNESAVRDIVGEGSEVAIKKRKVESAPHYNAVKENYDTVDTDPVIARIDKLIDDNKLDDGIARPLRLLKNKIKPVLGEKSKLVLIDGTTPPPKLIKRNVRDLRGASRHIQKLIGESREGIPVYDKVTLMEVKELLDTQISKVSEDYKMATDLWRKNSVAVNNAEMGEAFLDAYKMSLDNLPKRTMKFANLVHKYKSKKHPKTGKSMLDSLNPEQEKSLGKVLDHMSRQMQVKLTGARGAESMAIKAAPKALYPPGFFSPIVTVLRGHFNRNLAKADRATKERLAKLMLSGDNKALAKLMRDDLSPKQIKQVGDFITSNLDPLITVLAATASSAETKDERVRKFISKDKK